MIMKIIEALRRIQRKTRMPDGDKYKFEFVWSVASKHPRRVSVRETIYYDKITGELRISSGFLFK